MNPRRRERRNVRLCSPLSERTGHFRRSARLDAPFVSDSKPRPQRAAWLAFIQTHRSLPFVTRGSTRPLLVIQSLVHNARLDAHLLMPKFHKQTRLQNFDYRTPGAYFVTVVVHDRKPLLSTIESGNVNLPGIGQLVEGAWLRLSETYTYIDLDLYVIMPNHFHGILVISDTAESRLPIGRLVGAFKTLSTRDINVLNSTPGNKFWQDEFYDHIIRDDEDLRIRREYILKNPLNWDVDEENPQLM
jgi:REP element-mobilizing transposase RayT